MIMPVTALKVLISKVLEGIAVPLWKSVNWLSSFVEMKKFIR